MRRFITFSIGLGAAWSAVVLSGQGPGLYLPRDHPAIGYSARAPRDAAARLNERLARGEVRLAVDAPPRGYLRSVLEAFDIPISSQILVFSENSLQRAHISQATPRAIYFNDTVAVGWAKGAGSLEVAALDATQGVQFYSFEQRRPGAARFERRQDCLQCHLTAATRGVPGLFAMSVLPLSDNPNEYAQGWTIDHRTPYAERWGGWYVTGARAPRQHLGNVPVLHVPRSYVRADVAPALATGADAFDAGDYLSPHSDVAALMVLNHQTHATNLLTRLGWEARIAAAASPLAAGRLPAHVEDAARELVDYFLFVDEAPLPSPVRGSSGFARAFASRGPRDSRGRSLRDLDLEQRLLVWPCSYMIYSDAFDALPAPVKAHVYGRMWEVLSGQETAAPYDRLTPADRRAIVEILRETKTDLPAAFGVTSRTDGRRRPAQRE